MISTLAFPSKALETESNNVNANGDLPFVKKLHAQTL
jgi:hypothetical protein